MTAHSKLWYSIRKEVRIIAENITITQPTDVIHIKNISTYTISGAKKDTKYLFSNNLNEYYTYKNKQMTKVEFNQINELGMLNIEAILVPNAELQKLKDNSINDHGLDLVWTVDTLIS